MIETEKCWMKDTCYKYKCEKCCPEFCMKLFKLNYLYDSALMTDFQRKHLNLRIDGDGTDKEIFEQLKSIENSIDTFVNEGKNLFLHSRKCGNSKTSWSLRLIQAYFNKIWASCDLECKGLFINVPRFLISLKDNISHESDYIQHIKENVLSADIVIWDEVATKALTTYEHENLLYLINARIDAKKCNIYTSNLSPDELIEKLGDRLYSRVVNDSINFEFNGADKRGI